MRAVLACGYRGPLSLEVFNDEFRAAPARLIARDGLRSLILTESGAGALTLPAPPRFDGVEFLEFAVDAETGRELGELLRALGFRHAGHHRSKAVDLFRQGRANLILNAEQDSAAAEHFHLHGPSVCAMALRVDDTARAVARAAALLAPEWHERVGPGERRIPALRAPDGTLIYLVGPDPAGRSIYDDDFTLFGQAAPDAGHTSVDHVAQALPHGRMDGFVLFYRAMFGLQPQPLWELPDPYGLIQSRAMVSPDGSIRLPLNISESRETATGRFVTAYAGAGVHHIALATDDLVAAVRRCTALGAPGAADSGELLRRSGGTPRTGGCTAGRVGAAEPAVRPRRQRRVSPRVHRYVPRPVLLRDRGAARLPGFRRRQCASAHGRPGGAAGRGIIDADGAAVD